MWNSAANELMPPSDFNRPHNFDFIPNQTNDDRAIEGVPISGEEEEIDIPNIIAEAPDSSSCECGKSSAFSEWWARGVCIPKLELPCKYVIFPFSGVVLSFGYYKTLRKRQIFLN